MKYQEDINDLLAKHFADEQLTAEQQTALQEWIDTHSEEYRKIQILMNTTLKPRGQQEFDAGKAWEKVAVQLKDRPFNLPAKRRIITVCSLAASFVLVIATALYLSFHRLPSETTRYANATETEKYIVLPDSSTITLYPGAQLAFRYARNQQERQVELEGKAFFQVKKQHGHPFKIKTPYLKVEVLGTSFLVNAEKIEQAGVFVESGKVKVSTEDQNFILTAHEKAEMTDGNLEIGTIEDPQAFFGHKKTILEFNKTPLTKAIQEIEKQTGIRIELGNGFEGNTITTKIDTEAYESIAEELAFLCGCKCDTLSIGKHYRLYYE